MILVNKNTTQDPLTSLGRTGTQGVRFIPAARVYLLPAYTGINPICFFGVVGSRTITGAIDMGVIDGAASVKVSRTTNPVYSGIDRMKVGEYTLSTSAQIEFSLSQLDDFTVEQLLGVPPVSSIAGRYASYLVGSQSLLQAGLLLVTQNKLNGKEWQFFNPAALLSIRFDNQGDSTSLRVSGILPGFSGTNGLSNQLLSVTVAAPVYPPITDPITLPYTVFMDGVGIGQTYSTTTIDGVSL